VSGPRAAVANVFSKRAIRSLVLLGATLLLPGCGSWFNLRDGGGVNSGAVPYGGVLNDGWFIPTPLLPIALLDLPLSLVADTLTLPYTIQKCEERCAVEKAEEEKHPVPPTATTSDAVAEVPSDAVAPVSSDSWFSRPLSYETDVLPILASNCTVCHGRTQPDPDPYGKLKRDCWRPAQRRFETDWQPALSPYSYCMSNGKVVPGKPRQSLLISKINGNMRWHLSSAQVTTMTNWVQQGAKP
jgi:uncharacterized protein YceK